MSNCKFNRSSLMGFASWSVLLLFSLFSAPILAHTGVGTFGTIPGAVTDSTGAGRFHVPSLLPSVYTVQAELAGFKKFVQYEGIRPSIDAIHEFKVQTNITPAQSGASAGANLNVAARSGGAFHGSAFEFIRNDNIAARDFFAAVKPEFKQNQSGGTFGLFANRTFFFAT
jgi:hypothetical protein